MSEQGATSRTPDSGPLRTSTGSRVGAVLLSVDPASTAPPFRQLKNQIVEAINRGRFTTDARMPPVRTLASDVGVSTATAAKVYRELEEAGVLEGRGRSGTFVAAAEASGAVLASAAAEFADRATGSGFTLEQSLDAVRTAFSHVD